VLKRAGPNENVHDPTAIPHQRQELLSPEVNALRLCARTAYADIPGVGFKSGGFTSHRFRLADQAFGFGPMRVTGQA
jgi:hypothetical protein